MVTFIVLPLLSVFLVVTTPVKKFQSLISLARPAAKNAIGR
jgi:hypothetical protein